MKTGQPRRHLPKKWGFRPHHTKIHSPAPTKKYREGWERVFKPTRREAEGGK